MVRSLLFVPLHDHHVPADIMSIIGLYFSGCLVEPISDGTHMPTSRMQWQSPSLQGSITDGTKETTKQRNRAGLIEAYRHDIGYQKTRNATKIIDYHCDLESP